MFFSFSLTWVDVALSIPNRCCVIY